MADQTCASCNEKLAGETVLCGGRQLHPACFKCAACGAAFSSDSAEAYLTVKSAPYCKGECYTKNSPNACAGCGKPLGSQITLILNRKYHPGGGCFRCDRCGTSLTARYRQKNKMVMCMPCIAASAKEDMAVTRSAI